MSPLGTAAIEYVVRHGFAVLPLRRRSKLPQIPKWAGGRGYLDATTDVDQVRAWWTKWPEANIGISCIASGLIVIDVDPRNGGDETLMQIERECGPLPRTATVLTPSGGWHLYFRAPPGCELRTDSLGPGLDVKWRGYVVAPPSALDEREYRHDVGAHLDDMPLAPFAAAPASSKSTRTSSGTDARESTLGAAFELLGWLGDALPDGRRMVRCPWAETHTDGRGRGRDSSAVIFPRALGRTLGGFHCAHSHCATKTWRDVLEALPLVIRRRAELRTMQLRNRAAYERSQEDPRG